MDANAKEGQYDWRPRWRDRRAGEHRCPDLAMDSREFAAAVDGHPQGVDMRSVVNLLLWVQTRIDYYPDGRRTVANLAATLGMTEGLVAQVVRDLEEIGAPVVLDEHGIVWTATEEV